MTTNLHDQVAIVTGASSGIGDAIARDLAAAGMKLVLTARRADRLDALASALPTESVVLAAAIDDPATPQALLDLALSRFGRVDALINNAGMFAAGPLETVDLDELSRMISVNFESVVRSTYLFARHFKPLGRGSIVNVSSVGAYLPTQSGGVYGGLKHAMEVFTQSLRVELRGTGVKLGTVAPGTTETEIFDHLRAKGAPVRADATPPMHPDDIAAAVRFMLQQSPRATVARMLVVSSSETV